MAKRKRPDYEHLRLTDTIEPGVRLILVGINPGVMSAMSGHHFAGPTNRFWGLLYESGIVPEPVTHEDDVRLPQWGIGMTNLIARPSPGIDVLTPREYLEGWAILDKKIERYRPHIVAFVGVTMYRMLWKVISGQPLAAPKLKGGGGPEVKPGVQPATVHGARIFVLPNPSGRNAHFSYGDMLNAFTDLAKATKRLPSVRRSIIPPEGGSHTAGRRKTRASAAKRADESSGRRPPGRRRAGGA